MHECALTKALVTHKKQEDKVACYVAYYPHWQDPNGSEVEQVYQYTEQLDELKVPASIYLPIMKANPSTGAIGA